MRILYLTHGFPYPLTSGRLRQYHFIRELAQRHSVTLVSIVGKKCTPADVEAVEAIADRVVTVESPVTDAGFVKKLFNRLRMMATKTSPDLDQMRATVARLLRDDKYDAIFSSAVSVRALRGIESPPIICDICDSAALHMRGRIKHCPLPARPWFWLLIRFAEKFTAELVERTNHVIFASQRDLEDAVGGPCRFASAVPNGVDIDYWKRSTPQLGQDTLVFTGGMRYAPNEDAALYLIRDILPIVRRTVPNARLLIVGHSPRKVLVDAGQATPGVTVTGFVDDVRPYMEDASVFVAPLRFGAGIQNKLLEAMAMEVPVVTSQLAADGLLSGDMTHAPVEVAGSTEEYAAAIVRHLLARRSDANPDARGRNFVATHFQWETSGATIHRILDQVTGRSIEMELPSQRPDSDVSFSLAGEPRS